MNHFCAQFIIWGNRIGNISLGNCWLKLTWLFEYSLKHARFEGSYFLGCL